jgi:transposase
MPAALSVDLRTRAVDAYEAGEGTEEEIAARFAISTSSLRRWMKRKKATLSLEPSRGRRGPEPHIRESERPALRALVDEKPDRTLAELCEQWRLRTTVGVSISNMQRVLARMDISKKNASCRRTRSP